MMYVHAHFAQSQGSHEMQADCNSIEIGSTKLKRTSADGTLFTEQNSTDLGSTF